MNRQAVRSVYYIKFLTFSSFILVNKDEDRPDSSKAHSQQMVQLTFALGEFDNTIVASADEENADIINDNAPVEDEVVAVGRSSLLLATSTAPPQHPIAGDAQKQIKIIEIDNNAIDNSGQSI